MRGRALVYCAGGGIGDSLMASIVARALHSRFEQVDALTLPSHRSLLERVPDFDRVLVDEGGPDRETAAQIAQHYEAVLITWATARIARIAFAARIPVRVGQARRMYSWRFTDRVPVRSELGDVTTHWSQILLDYARAVDCDTPDTQPRLRLTDPDREQASALLRELQLRDAPYAIVHATNAIAPKRGMWPTGGWSQLVQAIRARFGVTVLLTGSNEDGPIVETIAAQSGGLNVAGRTSIGGFAALAERAAFFAGITTGSMHVAAAAGCPTAGIFPFQTDTPERWAPLGANVEIVRASYPCRPGERKETCPDYACIAHLDVSRIVAACEALRHGRTALSEADRRS